MDNIRGRFVFDDGKVTMRDVHFEFREAPVHAKSGIVVLQDNGRFTLTAKDLEVTRLRLDHPLRKIMPDVMAQFAQRLDDGKTFWIHTDLGIGWSGKTGEPARVEWQNATVVFDDNTILTSLPLENIQGQIDHLWGWSDGWGLELHGILNIESIRLMDQQITRLTSPLHIVDGWARFESLQGTLLGGELSGDIAISLDETPRYNAHLQMLDASLAEVANNLDGHQKLRGFITGRLNVSGEGNDLKRLNGKGEAHLREANLGQLPFMLRLINPLQVASRRSLPKNAFDSADIGITLQDGRADLAPVKFTGDAFSLQGTGWLHLQGDRMLDLRLSPLWGRNEHPLPIISDLTRELNDQVFDVHVSGPINAPKAHVQALPSVLPRVTEGVRDLGQRRAERQGVPRR